MLECLQLCGVRSYSPRLDATIHFDPKLTIIHGHNGAGKTTIIEALKFVTSGAYPPGSDGGRTFVFDPKLAGVPETNAAVRLRFRTHGGKVVKAARLLCLTRRTAKVTIKSSECQLAVVNEAGGTEVKTMTVSAFEEFIPELLGVSSAVLQNVTFCHQDKTLWPFSDSSELKSIFDEIFSTEVYTKAHENHRKFLKAKEAVWGEKKREVEVLREKEAAQEEKRSAVRRMKEEIATADEERKERTFRLEILQSQETQFSQKAAIHADISQKSQNLASLEALLRQLQAQLPASPPLPCISLPQSQLFALDENLKEAQLGRKSVLGELRRAEIRREHLKEQVRNVEEEMDRKKVEMAKIQTGFSELGTGQDIALLEERVVNQSKTFISDLETALKQAKNSHNEKLSSLKSTQAALAQLRLRLASKDSDTADSQTEFRQASRHLSHIQAQITANRSHYFALTRESDTLIRDIEAISATAKSEKQALDVYDFYKWLREVLERTTVVKGYEETVEVGEVRKRLEREWESGLEKAAGLRAELQRIEAEVRTLEGEIGQMSAEAGQIASEIREVQGEIEGPEELQDMEERLKALELGKAKVEERAEVWGGILAEGMLLEGCGVCGKKGKQAERKATEKITAAKHQETIADREIRETQSTLCRLTANHSQLSRNIHLLQRQAELSTALSTAESCLAAKRCSSAVASKQLSALEAQCQALRCDAGIWDSQVGGRASEVADWLNRPLGGPKICPPTDTYALFTSLARRKEALETQLEALSQQYGEMQTQAVELERELNRLSSLASAQDHTTVEIATMQGELSLLQQRERAEIAAEACALQEIERIERESAVAQREQMERGNAIQKLKSAEEAVGRNRAKKEAASAELQTIDVEIEQLSAQGQALDMKIATFERDLEAQNQLQAATALSVQYQRQTQLIAQKKSEAATLSQAITALQAEVADYDPALHRENARQISCFSASIAELSGKIAVLQAEAARLETTLGAQDFSSAVARAELGVSRLSAVLEEHKCFLQFLDSAIMAYHSLKINQVNALLRDYWRLTYRGKDIDCIELRAEPDTTRKVKSYNYRLVLHGASTDMDMRGRCSAGQKVLASLVLRLALAQAFSGVCGVIALDEPTTALDKDNTQGLAEVLAEFVQLQKVQLIVITHDMEFVESLMRLTQQGMFYEVEKVKEESRVSVRTIR